MKDREGFYRTVSAYLRKGVMKEIFTAEDLVILRVADSFYIASNYTASKEGYVAFLVNGKMIRAMMVDHSFLERLAETSDQQMLSQMMFCLTDKTFGRFRRWKGSPFSDLTHRFVDPELEEWIFKTYGLPISPETQQNKKRLLR